VYTCRSEEFYKAKEEDFGAFAREMGVPFYCDTRISQRAAELRNLDADIAISVNWLTILSEDVLSIFRFGVLNAHAGDLPRYRGNACPNWAILNFENQIGLTVHRMTGDLDSGPVAAKAHFPIGESTYIGDVYEWMDGAIPQLFGDALERILTHGMVDQDGNIVPLRTFPRRPEDARIHWASRTRDILALIRASSHPFAGAYAFLEAREMVRIFRARPYVPGYRFMAVPGQVCLRNGENPVIATVDGMIEIEDCMMEGSEDASAKVRICSSLRNRLT